MMMARPPQPEMGMMARVRLLEVRDEDWAVFFEYVLARMENANERGGSK